MYDTVIANLEDFFKVWRIVIFERARFNQQNQSEGESVEQYITALYNLVKICKYGALKDEMIRNWLVIVGIANGALSERLQPNPKLTLEKNKNCIQQREAVKEQHRQLQDYSTKTNPIVLDEVTGQR